MKRKKIKILSFVILSLLLLGFLIFGISFLSDPVLMEFRYDGDYTIVVRSSSSWEASVPIYFQVAKKRSFFKFTLLESSPLYYASPQSLEAKTFDLQILKLDKKLVYFQVPERPNEILGIADMRNMVLYPPIGIKGENYYTEVKKAFLEIAESVNNKDLVLRR